LFLLWCSGRALSGLSATTTKEEFYEDENEVENAGEGKSNFGERRRTRRK
jgi:hypothetical protein